MPTEINPNESQEVRHIFFDLDGTLTESRSEIENAMTEKLRALARNFGVVVISGAKSTQMQKQIPWLIDGTVVFMGQSGNEAWHASTKLWENRLEQPLLDAINAHIECVRASELYRNVVREHSLDENDIVEWRGGQVSFSLIGHNADKTTKKNFDPAGALRREILKTYPIENRDLDVRAGGTTCLDYTRIGWNKAGNAVRLIEQNGWQVGQCLYIGDQLYEGGNDEVMKLIMPTLSVTGPQETTDHINKILDL